MNTVSNPSLKDVLEQRRSVRQYSDAPLSLDQLMALIWAGQGVTGADGFRTVPSAHGLHPLRLMLAVGAVTDLSAGLYDVSRETNELSQVRRGDIRDALKKASVDEQAWIADAAAIITICADFVAPCKAFADQKPYGRRGASYVAIEAGAAAQNIMLMATSFGLGSVLVAGIDDDKTADVLGLEAPYAPVLHVCVGIPQ